MSGGIWRRAATASVLAVATVGFTGVTLVGVSVPRTFDATANAGSAPESASVVIGKGAPAAGYQTKQVTLAGGGHLSVVNFDDIEHTVTSKATDTNGNPLFDTFAEPNGTTTTVAGVSRLAAGTYNFYCRFHPTKMRGKLIIRGGGGGVRPAKVSFDQPLVRPKTLTTSHIHITLRQAGVRVLPHGPLTKMWTFGGTYPGPTIVRPAGHDTKVTFINHLPKGARSVTIHFHGDHHKSANDGQPTTHLIRHGKRRTYDYPLTDAGKPERAAFDFYHDHRMMETSRNVWHGLEGMFIVTDNKSKKLHLPQGKFDVPLMISNRSFTSSNQLTNPFPAHPTMPVKGPQAPPGDGTVGAQILANGRFAPYLNVSTHRYRLRILNGSNFTPYNFSLSDGHPFVQVGTGDGLLPKPVVRQNILLGPAQRVDVIVDFHGELHKKVLLQTVARTDGVKNGLDTPTASIMQFRVTHKPSGGDSTRIPSTLQAPPKIHAPRHAAITWNFNLGGNQSTGTYWTVNGRPFNPNHVSYKVQRGRTQTWKLHNASTVTHFIHLHEEQWHTIARDGKRPPPWERGLEDTWKLDPGETVKVAAHFTDYLGVFMIHCHMLDHEDHGLMAYFEVVAPHAKSSVTTASAIRLPSVFTVNSRPLLAPRTLPVHRGWWCGHRHAAAHA